MCQPKINVEQFWKAIKIYIENSHVINRRLGGVIQNLTYKVPYSPECFQKLIENIEKITFNQIEKNNADEILNLLYSDAYNKGVILDFKDFDDDFYLGDNHDSNIEYIYVNIHKLLPRNSKFKDTYTVCILNCHGLEAVFRSIQSDEKGLTLSPQSTFFIKYTNGDIFLDVPMLSENDHSAKWMNEKLLPQIKKWALSNGGNSNGITQGSLNLVSLERYNVKYQELKIKYGEEMVKIWPETTDPSKFVFEDVAIATYLILLWEDEHHATGSSKLQSFVDLGCGNGLLVYILNSEGYPGRGVDVRKRKIWDMYPDYVKLAVEPVTPSEEFLYKGTDWLLGNHSDELTPWVPVLAARSSYKCRFFLLPCCAYEFDGKKYQRVLSSKSQYNEYLLYVKKICDICGIKTEFDRLKIPSTKRICLVGTERLYTEENHALQVDKIQEFIDERCKRDSLKNDLVNNVSQGESWVEGFKPREAVEKVRNCTRVDKAVIDAIVSKVTSTLLSENNYLLNKLWNAGGCLNICDVVKLMSPDQLKMLKKECGGMQTLLRNHHHIFEVHSGKVKFRHPKTKAEMSKLNNMKKNKNKPPKERQCWFFANHPDGCPLSADDCSYLHNKE